MLLCKRHNDSGAGFPRSDGRLPSLLEPILRDANRDFQGQPMQVSVSSGCKDGLPLTSSAVIGVPSGLGSSVSFHSPQRAFVLALQCCSFSSGSQPELLFLAGFTSPFGSSPFSLGSFALSCEALFPLLAGFVGPFESCPFAFSCEALFSLLAGFAGSFDSYALAFLSGLPFVACPSRWSFKTFSRSPPNSRDPLSDIFSSNTSCSLFLRHLSKRRP